MRKNVSQRWSVIHKMFFSLFLTGTVIEFSWVGSGLIDGLIISHFLGSEEMAAEGIVHPIFSIFGVISGLLAVGMQTRCAQAIGRGDRREYSRFVSVAVCTGVFISLILTALLQIFAKPFAILLGASGNAAGLAGLASEYLTGLSIGTPSLILTAILAPAFQLDTGRRIIGIGAIVEAVSDIILDIVAIKLDMGLFGIGLASACASYLNLLIQCTFFLKKNRILHFVKPHVSLKEFGNMLANGSEKAVRRLSNILRPVILNAVIISYGGTIAMSALSVRNNFSNFIEIFGAGIASAVSLLTGVFYGEMNEEGIEEVNKYEHRMILIFPFLISTAALIFAGPIAGLYIAEKGPLYDMVVFAIRILAVQMPLLALIESRIKYLQAIQRKSNMNVLTLAARFVFVIISAFLLGNLFGSYGIIASFAAGDVMTLAAIYIYYAVKYRKICLTRQDFLNLPDSFHLHPGSFISLDIRNLEDVSLASEQIMLFCNGHSFDRRTAYYASLAFEELASNIVLNVFPGCVIRTPMIDLRVVASENTLIIRLRDNCPRYDVTEQISAANESDDPMHHIGIRIVSKIASDITYLNTFETNNLIIRFRTEQM